MPTLTIEGSNRELSEVLIYLEGLQNGKSVPQKVEAPQEAKAGSDTQDKPKSNKTRRTRKSDKTEAAKSEPAKAEEPVKPEVKEEPKPEVVEAEVIPPEEPKATEEAPAEPKAEEGITLASLSLKCKKIVGLKNQQAIKELSDYITPFGGLQNVPENKWEELNAWADKYLA